MSRKCRACKAPYEPRNSLQKACSIMCAMALAKIDRERRERKEAKERRREQREAKQRIKPLSTLCTEAQRDVNRYIMARDRAAGYPCISCGSPDITEAGHYFHAGSKYRTSRFRFDHSVINAQCSPCNRHLGGNQHGYRLGYIERYGLEAFEEMEELKRKADRGELAPLTKDEVRQIAAEHRAMTRELIKRMEAA